MEKAILDALESLKLALESDHRRLLLEEREKAALRSTEVLALKKALDERKEAYDKIRSLDRPESNLLEQAQKDLYQAKLAFDSHPLVASYLSAYRAFKEVEREVDDIVFGPYRKRIINLEGLYD